MNGLCYFIILLYFNRVICENITLVEINDPDNEAYTDFDDEFASDSSARGGMKSTLCKIQKKYACYNHDVEGNHVLEYGRRAWTFPLQDTSLTLTYPSENFKGEPLSEDMYLITGFEVILYMDGGESRGYITSGGIFQRSISLQFNMRNLTTLGYQFWFYGITSTSPHFLSTDYTNMCS